jgi:hypothetical protein
MDHETTTLSAFLDSIKSNPDKEFKDLLTPEFHAIMLATPALNISLSQNNAEVLNYDACIGITFYHTVQRNTLTLNISSQYFLSNCHT